MVDLAPQATASRQEDAASAFATTLGALLFVWTARFIRADIKRAIQHPSAIEKGEQVREETLAVRQRKPVRRAFVDFELAALDQL